MSHTSSTLGSDRPVDVWTQRYDNFRSGANLRETILTPENVKVVGPLGGFGKLYARSVDGQIHAQPLYISSVKCGDGVERNLVIVVTATNWVYAFDADNLDPDSSSLSAHAWAPRHLGIEEGRLSSQIMDAEGRRIFEMGITSTPVIDATHGIIYVVAKHENALRNRYGVIVGSGRLPVDDPRKKHLFVLYALRLSDGTTIHSVEIAASDGGWVAALDSTGGQLHDEFGKEVGADWSVRFDPRGAQNRPGLLLVRGKLYIAFGAAKEFSREATIWLDPETGLPLPGSASAAADALGLSFFDLPTISAPGRNYYDLFIWDFRGWILSYDATPSSVEPLQLSLKQLHAICLSPNVEGGAGVWMGGTGLAADHFGNIYFKTGNGPPASGPRVAVLDNALFPDLVGRKYKAFGAQYGDAFVKLSADLSYVARYVSPTWWEELNWDMDLGAGGNVLLPDGYLIGGGKAGLIYLLSQENLDRSPKFWRYSFRAAFSQWGGYFDEKHRRHRLTYDMSADVGDGFPIEQCYPHIHGTPVYWWRPDSKSYIYVWPEKDFLRVFEYDGSEHTFPDVDPEVPIVARDRSGAEIAAFFFREGAYAGRGMPGGMLSLSANGASAGIVWATRPDNADATPYYVPGMLQAFAAEPASVELRVGSHGAKGRDEGTHSGTRVQALLELWNSEMRSTGHRNQGPDSVGCHVMFAPPIVANGRVYVAALDPGEFTNERHHPGTKSQLVAYGLIAADVGIEATPRDGFP